MKMNLKMQGLGIAVAASIFLLSFMTPGQGGKNAESIARGKKVYQEVCIACHQADAGGVPRMTPPLIKTPYVLGNKEALIRIVIKGLKGGEVEVDGERYENPMPPQSDLTDQQIADVLTFVRNSFGNKASAVGVGEVKHVRNKLGNQ